MTAMPSIGPVELDVLQELASIGCGQALSALGRLLQRRLEMDVPEAWVGRGPGAIADFLGGMGRSLVAVAVRLEGLLEGQLVMVFPEPDAQSLARLLGHPIQPGEEWGTFAQSALMESGNIVGSAFVSAVAELVGRKLLLSVPRFARGGGRACMDALVDREVGSIALATRFCCPESPDPLEGLILVMPEPAAVSSLLASLRRS